MSGTYSIDQKTRDRWVLGETLPGVLFRMSQLVRIISGPNIGTVGQLISIRAVAPEPLYDLETTDWADLEVRQSDLVGITLHEYQSASEPGVVIVQRKIAETAGEMLAGTPSFIEGARRINGLRVKAQLLDFDPDIAPFIAIDSETDALPLGSVRKLWKPEALKKLQPEIERLERWAGQHGRLSCQKLIERFAGHSTSNV
jgi:hypothetical protein